MACPFCGCAGIAEDTLTGFEWDGSSFVIPKSTDLRSVNPNGLLIVHYYGLNEILYTGIRDLAFGREEKKGSGVFS
jgi:hypothetical protein